MGHFSRRPAIPCAGRQSCFKAFPSSVLPPSILHHVAPGSLARASALRTLLRSASAANRIGSESPTTPDGGLPGAASTLMCA